jgi:serine/threonine-protein kinase ULK/ATG1
MAEEWTTKKVDKFILVNKKLGQGEYGIVYRGFYADDESKQVAVKTIPIKVIQSF